VYRFVLYLSRNVALAEDLTAETFLRVWTSPVPVQLETVRAWLLAIARNLVFEQSRRMRRESEMADFAALVRIEESIDARRELAAVLAELEAMPEPDRAALLLRAEGDLSYRDIAHILGGTEQSVRVRVFRARARLEKVRKVFHDDRARSVR
jgi:RNA polymerase sigma-70 factor (ECF subfamily)